VLSAADNEKLTRTGPGTPMGGVFRQYWQPALLSRELVAGGAPKAVRILGEDFVAFRDAAGRVGVVEPRCPHRGANLIMGRVEDCGIRCAYHGWKFAADGECLDVPTAEPDVAERIRPKARLRSLHVEEFCDMVWVHFSEDPPALPRLDFSALPPDHYFVSKKHQQCNWAQAVEGGIDTAHFSFLHAAIDNGERAPLLSIEGNNEPAVARYRWLIEDPRPQFTVLRHNCGLVMCAARKADDGQRYWRLTQFMMPNHSMAPNSFPGDPHVGNTWVPIDDESCWIYCYGYRTERPLTDDERARYANGAGIFAAVDDDFVPLRNRGNGYLVDRELQRTTNFTGIVGISEQDAAIADSQGLIADRTREILGQTDLGIVRFRQMMLEAADAVARGEPPHGARAPESYRVRSGDAMSPVGADALAVVAERFGELAGQGLARA